MVHFSSILEFLKKFEETIASILKIILLSRIIRNKKFQRNSEKCIILGNGPSLSNHFSSVVLDKSYDFVAVNNFPLTDEYTNIKPEFLVLQAPEFWLDNVTDFYKENRAKLFFSIETKTNWELTLFVPHFSKKYPEWQKKLLANKNITIHFYNPTPVEGFKRFCFLAFKNNLGMPRPHNILIPSLIAVLNLGYKEIFLLGADHSWLSEINVDENNRVFLRQKHFYDAQSAKNMPMQLKGSGERKLHEVLEKFYLTFKGYFIIEEYSKSLNCNICYTKFLY